MQRQAVGEQDFAEIEYEPLRLPPGVQRGRSFFAAPSQPVAPRSADPVRTRFHEMRALAEGKAFAHNDATVFYRQGMFMADFCDDWDRRESFSAYYPNYQRMGYEQLRTYFTWRTKARQGRAAPTSLSYVFLYIYELLSNIGVLNPCDALDRLTALWQSYRSFAPALDKYLPGWLMDYHVYYDLPRSFKDYIVKNGLESFYPGVFLREGDAKDNLSLWNAASVYDVTRSAFYREDGGALLRDCFDFVLARLRDYCGEKGLTLEDVVYYSVSGELPWVPFRNALFYNGREQSGREVLLYTGDRYRCEGKYWFHSATIQAEGRRELAAYIVKKTESCLRRETRYKRRLEAKLSLLERASYQLGRVGIPPEDLERLIESAAAEFCALRNRTVVTVDIERLKQIREEALDIQDKLTVEEENPLSRTAPETNIPALSDASANSPLSPVPPETEPSAPPSPVSAEPWVLLGQTLTGTERAALALLCRGEDWEAFAAAQGLMPSLLIDSINEKAADIIGDTLIDTEDGAALYEDYKDKIAEMIG